MSTVKRLKWVNRLGKLLSEPGGLTVGHALRKAGENLETIRGSSLSAVDAHLDKIERICREAGREPLTEAKEALYRLANDIHGIAGVFGLNQLGEAAFSLCELIDRLRERSRWSVQAIEVHLAALRLFRHPDDQIDGKAVLAGLHRVVERETRAAEPG